MDRDTFFGDRVDKQNFQNTSEAVRSWLDRTSARCTTSNSTDIFMENDHKPQFRPMPPTLKLPTTSDQCLSNAIDSYKEGAADNRFLGPPIICEQAPSAPSSPVTSPRACKTAALTSDALAPQTNLLSVTIDRCGGGCEGVDEASRFLLSPPLPPPSYPTSDLGWSPRSSVSTVRSSTSGGGFADAWGNAAGRRQRHSDGSSDGGYYGKDLLSPGMMFSPAPYSPFSDDPGTPYSQLDSGPSPNLSPMPGSKRPFRFCFEPIRPALSSMSLQLPQSGNNQLSVPPPSNMSHRRVSKTRSRSDSDMYGGGRSTYIPTVTQEETTAAEPPTTVGSGQFKKRLLQKYKAEQQQNQQNLTASIVNRSGDDGGRGKTSHRALSTPLVGSPFSGSVVRDAIPLNGAFNVWLQSQMATWTAAVDSSLSAAAELLPPTTSRLRGQMSYRAVVPPMPYLYKSRPLPQSAPGWMSPFPPVLQRQTSMTQLAGDNLWDVAGPFNRPMVPGPIKAWRRSQSESDAAVKRHLCAQCGQGFAVSDRLAKHVASHHRRSSSIAEHDSTKQHKCTVCPKAFARSDMLTRHVRLHTGTRPYCCDTCGQVFSRSDHLSTHQRRHTGEKPYRCPKCPYAANRRDMITRHMRTHTRIASSADKAGRSQLDGNKHDDLPPLATLSLDSAAQHATFTDQ